MSKDSEKLTFEENLAGWFVFLLCLVAIVFLYDKFKVDEEEANAAQKNEPPKIVEYINQIQFERTLFNNRLTDAQQEIFWDKTKASGKILVVRGSVINVESSGWLSNATIVMRADNTRMEYRCTVQKHLNENVEHNVSKGQRVRCSGELLLYGELFGQYISLTNSTFSR